MLKNEKVAEGIAKMHPLKRIGDGSDSSSMAKFLLSNESSWITGQIIGVDGGRSKLTWSKLLKYHFYKNNIFFLTLWTIIQQMSFLR